VCNTTTADDFTTGSRAALRGGTTTVIDFACPNKGETLHHGLELWHGKADGKTYCDYGFHMTIDDWSDAIRAELPDMFAAGISSFKMYLTYPAMMIGDRDIYLALRALKKLGGIAGFHCENAGVIDGLIAERKAAGKLSPRPPIPISRPQGLEAEAVSRLLRIAQAADCPVVIVHLTNHEALEEVQRARQPGPDGSMWRPAPQYLLLDESRLLPGRLLRGRPVCLRAAPAGQEEQKGTSGAPCATGRSRPSPPTTAPSPWSRKDAGPGSDFTKIPGGLPGRGDPGRADLLLRRGQAEADRIWAPCAACCAVKIPPGCTVSSPGREFCAGAATRTSWSTTPKRQPRHPARWTASAAADYTPYEGFVTAGSHLPGLSPGPAGRARRARCWAHPRAST
jgi:dihydropyrimidinase